MNLDKIGYAWWSDPYSGWGVIGINYSKYWPGEAVSLYGPSYLYDGRTQLPDGYTLFAALGNDMLGVDGAVAFPVFEFTDMIGDAHRLLDYPRVITASQWNHDVLAEMGVESHMVHQGYDPELFHSGIRKPRTDGRFRVFAGGKAEWRKGQDLVLQGFKLFAETHDDAVLHAAWSSPWPQLAKSLEKTDAGAPPCAPGALPNFAAWAQQAGIKRHQFEVVPLTPNPMMPNVLADMDCAVFASRLEGGTNIAAMECIGCGIPTLLSWTTGHKDLPHHYTLDPCTPESIAEGLGRVYRIGRNSCRPDGIDEFGWPTRIAELVGVLKDA